MLTLMYKIKHNISPDYLLHLVPIETSQNHISNLRQSNNIQVPFCRTELYKRSFIPFCIKLWNNLNVSIRFAPSLSLFKDYFIKNREQNLLYYYGYRWANIHHARLRLGCSRLKYDLCFKLI